MSVKVALRQNAAPVIALVAGPALLWAAFTHHGNVKTRVALAATGGALLIAAYPQIRFAVRSALGVADEAKPALPPPPPVAALGPAPIYPEPDVSSDEDAPL